MLNVQGCCGSKKRVWGKRQRHFVRKLLVFFLCFSLPAGLLPAPARAADEEKLADIVEFHSITLHYAAENGQPEGAAILDNTLLEKEKMLALRYAFEITEEQCGRIEADTRYYLEVSPHLILPNLEPQGSALTMETEDGPQKFGAIFADGSRAWVIFDGKEDGSGTVLSEYGELQDAFFYLNCSRAGAPPADEAPIDGKSNLYAMKFENGEQLRFGYQENEPLEARAQVKKGGKLEDKTITWTVSYTPWQNPSPEDGISMDTEFELRDTIDRAVHCYVDGSVTIDGDAVSTYTSRDAVDDRAESWVLVETSENGEHTVLTFGGTRFRAGAATQGNPPVPLHITYQTVIRDELLLPGSAGGQKITNEAGLFAGQDGEFKKLNISSSQTVTVPQPKWLSKTGKTTRHTDGSGSTTDWTISFSPGGFSFTEENRLTLHDRLPAGSALVKDSLKVNGTPMAAASGEKNEFTVSIGTADSQPVTITYQTQAPEEMYDSGTSLGNNTAWFTFRYQDTEYATPQVTVPVDSGDGSGTPGTSTLVKTGSTYNPSTRTIDWTVTINPHRAWLKGGTFTDNLSDIGGSCGIEGHHTGLELAGDVSDIAVLIDNRPPTEDEKKLLEFTYNQQVLTVRTGEIGARTITFTCRTKVCDPCIFANNTAGKKLRNLISTEDMLIGKQSSEVRSASADCTVNVNAAVLTKKAPVYHYESGKMKWALEVNAAGLPMSDVVLEDVLPAGLTYVDGSLDTVPEIPEAAADTEGRKLLIRLGGITGKTMVTFDTEVEPEKAGFNSNEDVRITNTAVLTGKADGIVFSEVSHKVEHRFTNHGLVKSSSVNGQDELIRYEVLINPFGLMLPEHPSLVDTLDARLQLDMDTLRFYKVKLSGTTENAGQKPAYTKVGDGQPLKPADYNPENNSFRVQLPLEGNSRDAYVLTYTADIIKRQAGGYSNSVRFEGSTVLLGGSKNNSASVGGGGGGGGGGVAARKAEIAITKTDRENRAPLEGVTFTLYQWDNEKQTRGLPFAQGSTDRLGKVSFLVKPGGSYELVETESIAGYDSTPGWEQLPEGVKETADGLLITAGEAKSRMELDVTNEARKTDTGPVIPELQWTLTVHKVASGGTMPLEGAVFGLYEEEACNTLLKQDVSGQDGILTFTGLAKGRKYWLKELEAPEGYEVNTAVYQADEAEAAVTVPNRPKTVPVNPEEPGTSAAPDNQNPPGTSDSQNPSGTPDIPESPDSPDVPEHPNSSEVPDVPESSGSSDTLETAALRETSDTAGTEDLLNGSGKEKLPEPPEDTTENTENHNVSDSAENPGIPRTGNHTEWLIIIAVLSGILLAIMTVYGLWAEKRNEKK